MEGMKKAWKEKRLSVEGNRKEMKKTELMKGRKEERQEERKEGMKEGMFSLEGNTEGMKKAQKERSVEEIGKK